MGKRVDCAEATVNVNNSAYEKCISCRWLSTAHFRDTAMWKRGTVQHQHCCLLGNKNQPGSPSFGNDWPHRAVLGRLFAARTAQGDQHKAGQGCNPVFCIASARPTPPPDRPMGCSSGAEKSSVAHLVQLPIGFVVRTQTGMQCVQACVEAWECQRLMVFRFLTFG